MLVENQIVETTWSTSNKDWYIGKGYKFNKIGEKLLVKATDLMTSSGVKVKVKCDYCGEIKTIRYEKYNRVISKYNKYCCNHCTGLRVAECTLNNRKNKLYLNLLYRCENDGYILLSDKNDIVNNKTYIKYMCKKGHVNKMKISNFLSGKRCPECAIQNNSKRYKKRDEMVKAEIEMCGGTWKNYGSYKNQYENNLIISCPNCGINFKTSLILFTQHGGQVCKNCYNKISVGESKIKKFLEDNNISYIREKWFPDCRDVKPLPFDFYLPDNNICIEFDGKQHFDNNHFFSHTPTAKIKRHDEIKNTYCKTMNIKLIRISYKEINNINILLYNELIA